MHSAIAKRYTAVSPCLGVNLTDGALWQDLSHCMDLRRNVLTTLDLLSESLIEVLQRVANI